MNPELFILPHLILVLVLLIWKKCNLYKSFIGGVTNTAQYQNRLMVYDPKQVGVYVLCFSHMFCFKQIS